MNWKNEAIDRLNRYSAMVTAMENIPIELSRLEYDARSLKSCNPERIRTSVTAGPLDDRLINNLIQREELKRTLENAKVWVDTTDKAMSILTPEEQTILHHMYIQSQRGAVNLLCGELGLEQSSVYRKRDQALYRFTMALYGAT